MEHPADHNILLEDIGVADFLVITYTRDALVLRAGMASSGWSSYEVTFEDVSYMALPVMVDQASIRPGDSQAYERAGRYYDGMDADARVYELVEQPWHETSGLALPAACHLIVATRVNIRYLPGHISDPQVEN